MAAVLIFFIGIVAFAPLAAQSTPASPDAEQLFVRRVFPLLQDKCLACHGRDEEKIKGGLDLRTLASTLEGGDSLAPALVAGKPRESPLYLAAARVHDTWEAMPPKDNDALTSLQLGYLEQWIAAGGPWPDDARRRELLAQANPWAAEDGVAVRTSGGLSADWTDRRYQPEDLWAYQPLRKPSLPAVTGALTQTPPAVPAASSGPIAPDPWRAPRAPAVALAANRHPVDAFIDARLAAAQLQPAPAADRRTLIRRATFDLIGLPPTPEEISAFLADPAPDPIAFATVVERLLASPHYGEQWARHWLDVVRYADSSGFANDYVRGSAWRYRDYVVRAFNADKPYHDFIREQLAGDELAEKETGPRADELRVAAGFLRMGPWELTGMEVPRVARQRFLDDVTDSVGQTFLAHPLQCARCHDHKFDPIPTRDYYAFQAIFATTQLAERAAKFLPEENVAGFEEKKYLEQRAAHYRAIIERLDAKSIAAAREWLTAQSVDPAEFEAALAEVAKRAGGRGSDYAAARTALTRRGVPESRIPPKLAGFSPEDYGLERIARKGLERLKWDFDRYEPIAFSVYSGRSPEMKSVNAPLRVPANRMEVGELEESTILTGGDPFANGEKVTPAVLSAATFLGEMDREPAIPESIEGRRTALADWIASPRNPLTARVLVNRIWSWHFGTALAGNPNNFGATGKKPTHPELLDWLAATFLEEGGSIKALHRTIMSSAAYQRASAHPDPAALAAGDPQGELLAVFKPRRLAAEELRDAMLAVSGELNRTLGGIPARPEINREAALQPRQVMGTFAEAWQPAPLPEQRHRRSLYTMKIRGLLDPFMEVFNAPSPDLSCEGREASTVTPQVFALLNSVSSYDRALALAARLRRESGSEEAALSRAFAVTLGRAATAAELQSARAHVSAMVARHRTLTFSPPDIPREVVREAVEENTGEKFKFTEPLEFAADFVPDLTPAAAPVETRALAELCLVLFNTNEFAYVY